MCEGYLARLRVLPSADHSHVGYRMVRAAERAHGHKSVFGIQFPGDRMYFGRFQRFVESKRRQYGRYAFCKHGFAGSGRSYHDYVVPAGSGYLQSPFYIFLAFHVGKVRAAFVFVFVENAAYVDFLGFWVVCAFEKGRHFFQCVHAVHFQPFDNGGFTCVFSWQDDAPESALTCFYGYRQCAAYAFERAVERQFAHYHELRRAVVRYLSRCGQYA